MARSLYGHLKGGTKSMPKIIKHYSKNMYNYANINVAVSTQITDKFTFNVRLSFNEITYLKYILFSKSLYFFK